MTNWKMDLPTDQKESSASSTGIDSRRIQYVLLHEEQWMNVFFALDEMSRNAEGFESS